MNNIIQRKKLFTFERNCSVEAERATIRKKMEIGWWLTTIGSGISGSFVGCYQEIKNQQKTKNFQTKFYL